MGSYIKQANLLMTVLLVNTLLLLLSAVEKPIDINELGIQLVNSLNTLEGHIVPDLPERLAKMSEHAGASCQ